MFSILLITLLSNKATAYIAKVASTSACFNAKDLTDSSRTIFTAPQDGFIEGIILEYVGGGGVTCVTNGKLTNWGCIPGLEMQVHLYKVTDKATISGFVMYPKENTDGYTLQNGVYGAYKLEGFDRNSKSITITKPYYTVSKNDEFMLAHSEAFKNVATTDNGGKTCAKVIFLYSVQYRSVLASAKACLNAKDTLNANIGIFNAPENGVVVGAEFEHISGKVTCVTKTPDTNWGCDAHHESFTYLYKVTNENNRDGFEFYPKKISDGYIIKDDFVGSYKLKGFDRNSKIMNIMGPVYAVKITDKFMLQWSEAMRKRANTDNTGSICAKVRFIYSNEYKAVEANSNACFDARDRTKSTVFNAPQSGILAGINLEHNSGAVTCVTKTPDTKWGCSAGLDIFTWLYKIKDLSTYDADTIFPKELNTRGVTMQDYNYGAYLLKGFDRNSPILSIMDPITSINTNDKFYLQFSEAHKQVAYTDNRGSTCAKVTFIYTNKYRSVLAKDKACFDAYDKTKSTIFNAPQSGIITGIQLEHINGKVGCVGGLFTNWGCSAGHDIITYLYKVKDESQFNGFEFYPKKSTNGYTITDIGVRSYKLNGYNRNSQTLNINGPIYSINTNDKFMLQYAEAHNKYAYTDNHGAVCAKVTFIYSNEYSSKIASSNACFSAKNKLQSTIFNVPQSGVLAGVQLNYNNGGVQCAGGTKTYKFGCSIWQTGIQAYLMKVQDETNKIGYTLYPQGKSTNDYTPIDLVYGAYQINGFNRDSDIIPIINPASVIVSNEKLMLQHYEAYNNVAIGDNVGNTCATVTLIYSNDNYDGSSSVTPKPTPNPTPKPTPKPVSSGTAPIYVGTPTQFEQANDYCKTTYGTSLFIINTDQDFQNAKNLCGNDKCWIGLSDQPKYSSNGDYWWVDGSIGQYGGWYTGQPANKEADDCAYLDKKFGGHWFDANCDNSFPFLCKPSTSAAKTIDFDNILDIHFNGKNKIISLNYVIIGVSIFVGLCCLIFIGLMLCVIKKNVGNYSYYKTVSYMSDDSDLSSDDEQV